MSDKDLKKALNTFLGLTPQKPENHIHTIVQEWKKMGTHEKMPPEFKEKSWQNIREKTRQTILKQAAAKKEKKAPKNYLDFMKAKPRQGRNNKKTFLWASAAIILVILTISIKNLIVPPNRLESIILTSNAPGIFVNGKEISKENLQRGLPLSSNTVITSTGTNYRLQFSNFAIFELQQKSRLNFYEKNGTVYINLTQGALAAVVNSGTNPGKWQFLTPTGKINVTGTVFYTKVISAHETYFCICHGKVELITKNESMPVGAKHHRAYTMLKQNGAEKIIDDTMKYHHDPLLNELAGTIHYHISWPSR